MKTARHGFTLIELLVVVSIISLLIAILLPALGAARETTKTIICANHHKQLMLATQMYVDENKNIMPQPFQDNDITVTAAGVRKEDVLWFNALDDYLGQQSEDNYSSADERNYNIFKQDPVYDTFGENTGFTGGNGSRTIKMNQNFGDLAGSVFRFHTLDSLQEPTKTVVYFDGLAIDAGLSINSGLNTAFHGNELAAYSRHRGAVNVAFADGHVEAEAPETQELTRSSITYDAWFEEPDDRQPFIWDFDAP